MESQQSNMTTKIIGGIVAVAAIAGIASYAMKDNTQTPTMTTPADTNVNDTPTQDVPTETTTTVVSTTTTSTTSKPTTSTAGHTYKDGSYTATGSYRSPAGTEQVSLTLALKNDVVTDSTFSATSNSSQSLRYQAQFTNGYKAQVVGKNLADITVGKVSGSSLTGNGFNDALAKIKAEAKM